MPAWGTALYGGVVDAAGASLVMFLGDDTQPWYARWLAADGTPLTPVFRTTSPGMDLDPMIGGGFAVSSVSYNGPVNATRVFTGVLPSGTPTDLPAPAWLAATHSHIKSGPPYFQSTPRSSSYIFIGDPDHSSCTLTYAVVAVDGTLCGNVLSTAHHTGYYCNDRSTKIGLDGTLIDQDVNNGDIYRWWPKLFH